MSVSILKECGKVLVIVLCCVEGVLTGVGLYIEGVWKGVGHCVMLC